MRSQDVTLCVGMPVLVHKTSKMAEEYNSEMWTVVELGEDSFKMRRQILDIDEEEGKTEDDMETHEMKYEHFQYRCWVGFCLTAHACQGKTFKEKYTIWDWDFHRMFGPGRYVTLSRREATSRCRSHHATTQRH